MPRERWGLAILPALLRHPHAAAMGRYYRRRYRLAAQQPRRHRRGRHSGARAEVPARYHGSAGQMPERSTAAAQDERLPPQSRPESRRDPQPARGHCRRLLRRATARGRPPVAERRGSSGSGPSAKRGCVRTSCGSNSGVGVGESAGLIFFLNLPATARVFQSLLFSSSFFDHGRLCLVYI